MRAFPRGIVGLAVAAAVVAVLAVPKILDIRRDSAPSAVQSNRILRVSAHRVRQALLRERLATTGTIRANEEVEIVSEISGKVSAIYFTEGSRVAAGALLLKIDDSELLAERQRRLYRVSLAERTEARQKRLLSEGVISSENYDVALGELNVLRAELQLAEAQLEKTEIRAPFGGIIGLRWVSPGSYLSSQTRIASLTDLDSVKLDFSVPEKYSALLGVGDEISFTVEGSDRAFPGTIFAIEPSIETTSRSLRMRARCPNPGGVLVPGGFANVDLVLRSIPDALTVPSIAVVPELGGKKVFVYQDGVAQQRSVKTGIRSDVEVQITEGLSEGDLVITSGILQMRPGLEIEIEIEESPPGFGPNS